MSSKRARTRVTRFTRRRAPKVGLLGNTMGISEERQLHGVEIDMMELVEANAKRVDAVEDVASDAFVAAASFNAFKTEGWIPKSFSNVHLGKPMQQVYNGYCQLAFDAAIKYVRTGTTFGTRVSGLYALYGVYVTQLEGEKVRIYVCKETLDALADLCVEADKFGVEAPKMILKTLLDAHAFILGVRDVTGVPMSRLGTGAPEVYNEFSEQEIVNEALGHLLQNTLGDRVAVMRESASKYAQALAASTMMGDDHIAAPVTICDTVDTLLNKSAEKIDRALKPSVHSGEQGQAGAAKSG